MQEVQHADLARGDNRQTNTGEMTNDTSAGLTENIDNNHPLKLYTRGVGATRKRIGWSLLRKEKARFESPVVGNHAKGRRAGRWLLPEGIGQVPGP